MRSLKLILLFIITLPFIARAQKEGLINSGKVIREGTTLYDSSDYKKSFLTLNKINRSDTNYVWSLYERALTCEADSQFNKAIAYCQEGLALKEQRDYEPDLYNTWGNSLSDLGKYDEALKVFDTAIAKYPLYSLLYFNKGSVQIQLKHYTEAEALFQKTLIVNPYMYSAHYQLGLAALKQGKLLQAFLSTLGYLTVNPQGKYFSKSINLLNQISKSTDEILAFKNERTYTPDANYQAMEEIVLSKIALDKQYKPLIALDDPISRQIQVIFEKLDFDANDKDFYVQYYLPFYKQVYKDGKFELFVNHAFSNVNIPQIQDYGKKNKKALETFKTSAADYFNGIRTTKELFFARRDTVSKRYYYENGQLEGKGALTNNGKTLTGHWDFYYVVGNIKSYGEYNALGKREGEWKYFFYTGAPKAIEHYKNGALDGSQTYYFENGNLSSTSNYINDKPEGMVTTYFYAGAKKAADNYKMGKKDGESRSYYSNGNLKIVGNYVNGVVTGPYKEYYKSGQLKEEGTYVADKLEGPYKSYYENGPISAQMTFSKDNLTGEWKAFYENGKVKESRNYVAGKEDGPHQEFYENGQVSSSFTAQKAKMNGEANYFDKDGKPYAKFMYDGGVAKSAKYLSKTGAVLSSAELTNGTIDIVSYMPDGIKKAHFAYDKKGDINGPDTIFYSTGKIYQINQYKNGDFNGMSVTYYLNGTKKAEVNMTDGNQNGYYQSYSVNGKPETEGWMVEGNNQGEWLTYDIQGKLSTRAYYLDGELHGYKEEYDPAGHETIEQKYRHGWLQELTQFGPDGKIITSATFPKATGKYNLVFPNGKPMVQANYLNGDFDGAYKTFFFDGSTESVYYYKKGLLDSTYTSNYYGGGKYQEGHYKYGSKWGDWKTYEEEGTLAHVTPYANDMMNGTRIYYNPNGTKDFVAEYKDDQSSGITQKFDVDGFLAYQTIFDNDKAIAYTYLGKDGKLLPYITIAPNNGLFKAYYANGKVSRECNYVGGVKSGKLNLYYATGIIRSTDETSYGVSEGADREYYPDGKMQSEYLYVNDNYHGICREFYKNGTVKKEMTYVNGVNHGPTKYYNESGKLIKTLTYEYGKLLAVNNEK